jgi:alpha-beta hydrolase superfamily lysophospholipase
MTETTQRDAPVTGVEHWTHKGDVRLFLWEKFVGTPQGKPAVLFVHGSSMASKPTFDMTVPGRADSSVMDWFARRGFVCWCVDMEGYGRSDKQRDIYCDIANGADDLAAATDYIAGARGVPTAFPPARCAPRCSRSGTRSASPGSRSTPSCGPARVRRRSSSGARSCRSS